MKIRKDLVLHFFVCFILTTLLLVIAQFWIPFAVVAIIATLAIGVWKEIRDIKTTGFDWLDILADMAGIIASLILWGITLIGG